MSQQPALGRSRLSSQEALALVKGVDLLDLLSQAESVTVARGRVYFHEHRFLRLHAAPQETRLQFTTRIMRQAHELILPSTTEIRLLTAAELPLERVLSALRALAVDFPDRHFRAPGAPQIVEWMLSSNQLVPLVVEQLKEAGAHSIDGRGAGLFGHDLGPQAGSSTLPADEWLAIHRAAHEAGLTSEATMVYGHGESWSVRLGHLEKLRALQDRTGGFTAFLPLANQFQSPEDGFARSTPGCEDLRLMALARLYLDNFPHVGASWGRLGSDITQIALLGGVDDLEGSVSHDRNSRVVGARPFRSKNRTELVSLIARSGRTAVERDGFYRAISEKHPALAPGATSAMAGLLYKAEKRGELTREERLQLAKNASPIALGLLARSLQPAPAAIALTDDHEFVSARMLRLDQTVGPKSHVCIDLGRDAGEGDLTLAQCQAWLEKRLTLVPETKVTLCGIKGLWRMARRAGLDPEGVLSSLRPFNLQAVGGSLSESEDDLTPTEKVRIHQAAHALDLPTMAKLELSAPYNGTEGPFWERFVDRLEAITAFQNRAHGVTALLIAKAASAFVTPVEFLQAIALARLTAANIPSILVPAFHLPALMQQGIQESSDFARASLKWLPTMIAFGADGIAAWGLAPRALHILRHELERSGYVPGHLDSRFLAH